MFDDRGHGTQDRQVPGRPSIASPEVCRQASLLARRALSTIQQQLGQGTPAGRCRRAARRPRMRAPRCVGRESRLQRWGPHLAH
eukprot:1326456-Pyramimonas_sp.AAC.1